MNEINSEKSTLYVESSKSRHKKWVYASNACYQFPESIIGYIQGAFLLSYFETVVGLNIWSVFLAATIFIFYDAFNDPLIGFLVDRNLRFTKKWGRIFKNKIKLNKFKNRYSIYEQKKLLSDLYNK